MIYYVVFVIALSVTIGILWANGIERMHRDHPDYKGEDLFDEEDHSL